MAEGVFVVLEGHVAASIAVSARDAVVAQRCALHEALAVAGDGAPCTRMQRDRVVCVQVDACTDIRAGWQADRGQAHLRRYRSRRYSASWSLNGR